MAYRYGSSSYGTPSYGSSYGGLGAYPSRYAGLYDRHSGATFSGSTASQRIPPPAGQDTTSARDRWRTTSASADRIGQREPTTSHSASYPSRYTSPVRESAYSTAGYPHRSSSSYLARTASPARESHQAPSTPSQSERSSFPQYSTQYAPQFNPNPVAAEPLRDRWHSSIPGSASADLSGASSLNRSSAYGAPSTTRNPVSYPSYSSASRIPSTPGAPFASSYLPQREPAPPPTEQRTVETPPAPPEQAPQKTKAELAAERQRKIDEKRHQMARAAEGNQGNARALALDEGGQAHETAEVVNEIPFAVDNSGRCHPSPARQRPPAREQPLAQAWEPVPSASYNDKPPPLPPSSNPLPPQQSAALEEVPATTVATSKPVEVEPVAVTEPVPGQALLQEHEYFCVDTPHKGSVHLYRDEERVTVISVHRDDVEPYFSIRMSDGREKQTVGARLSPVIYRRSTADSAQEAPPATKEPAACETAAAPEEPVAPCTQPSSTPIRAPYSAPDPAEHASASGTTAGEPSGRVKLQAPAPVYAPVPHSSPSQGLSSTEPAPAPNQKKLMEDPALQSKPDWPVIQPLLNLSEDRSTRIQQLSAHLAQLKKQRSDLLNQVTS